MSAVNMSETEYYKSGAHTKQFDEARKLAKESTNKKKEKRVEDYNLSPSVCEHCSDSIDYLRRVNKFCSKSCSASFNNVLRESRSKKSKDKTSAKMKGNIPQCSIDKGIDGLYCRLYSLNCNKCDNIFLHRSKLRKSCSDKCKNELQGEWLRHNRAHIKGNGKKSYMEESFEIWLNDNCNFKWYSELHFKNHENNRHGWLDFVFPRKKLIIELDGSHHIKRKDIDAVRDEYLIRVRGYTVLRITHSEYIKGERIDYLKSILS